MEREVDELAPLWMPHCGGRVRPFCHVGVPATPALVGSFCRSHETHRWEQQPESAHC